MTEKQLRNKVVKTAKSFEGAYQGNSLHLKIINTYNNHKPLARGYALKVSDAWCAGTVSAVSILCNLTDIMPTECGCEPMIELYKKLGRWVENDGYIPKEADVIFYDWGDSGKGDCKGRADHVGIVVSVTSTHIKVFEGNYNNRTDYRLIPINARYIRGFGVPDYKSKATATKKVLETTGYKEGDNSIGVLGLKQMLLQAYKLGIITIKVKNDKGYGKGTEKAVNQILKKLGYKKNGIAGEKFIKKLGNLIREGKVK